MAVSLPIVSASSDGQSPPSDDGSASPQSPASPPNNQPMALPQLSESQNTSQLQSSSSNPTAAQPKRKPSRRANTAERRATHNAVERQRRETLNGRFLDLAALLSNLSQIRRPSKSAIVNSSIAHIHASRRHRILASRELRILKLESDALRRELNEWRDRAGLPRVDEPVRGDGFAMVLSGEVEVLATAIGEEEDEGQQFDGFEEGDEELSGTMPGIMDEGEDVMAADPLMNGGIFGHNITAGSTSSVDTRMVPRAQIASHGGPVIAQMPPSVSFENPAIPALYEPQVTPHYSGTSHMGQHGLATPEVDKVSSWATNMCSGYNAQLQLSAQRTMITPPNSTLAVSQSPSSVSAAGFTDYAYLANLKRQQLLALQHQRGAMAYAVDGDDASSVGSSQSERERSGSACARSSFGSPPRGTTSPSSYELSNAMTDFTMARRIGTAGLHINTTVPGSWSGRGEEGMNGMAMKQAMNPPMHVVPNGGGYGGIML